MSKLNPPRWIDRLLEWILKDRFADEILGDLHEWYTWKQDTLPQRKLVAGYFKGVALAIKPYKIKKVDELFISLIDIMMISNNIKIGIRSLLQHRLFTSINVLGLTISLVSFLFIYAYIRYELSYDNFHTHSDQVYRVLKRYPESGVLSGKTPSPLAEAFLTEFEGRIEFARLGWDPVFIEENGERYYEPGFYWGDSSLFDVFSLPFLHGDPEHALTDKNTVVLTQAVAEKYFGKGVNPVGQLLKTKIYDGNAELLMRVDGVLKELPSNTDLPFKLIGAITTTFDLYQGFAKNWDFYWLETYASIPNKNDLHYIREHIPEFVEKAIGPEYVDKYSFFFQPFDEIHLYSGEVEGVTVTGNIRYIITFSIIGIFIIVIATINYLNLMGARMNKRRKEAGMRKVMGASKTQLFGQYITESNLTLLISFALGLLLAIMLWPVFIRFLGKDIPLDILFSWDSLLVFLCVIFLSGTLAGLYPAWLLTSISSAQAIHKQDNFLRKNRLQKVLVAFQFAISIFLIVTSLMIFRQIHYMSEKDLGFNKDQLVSIKVEDRALQEKILTIKAEMG